VIARTLMAISREDLRSQTMAALAEMQEIEILGTVENSGDLLLAVESGSDLDLVLIDDQIGSLPFQALTREVLTRHPDIGVILMTSEPTAAFFQAAMDAGARAVVEAPPSVDELSGRIPSILEWQRQVRAMSGYGLAGTHEAAGRLIAFTGAKGGVGTTTVALHAALLAVSANPDRRVCFIDLDLQQRGIRQLLDLNARRTIADLVTIADSLTGRNLDEAVLVHQTGLRILLAPQQGEQAEDITGDIARQVLAGAKGHYDLVIVDCGSVVTEAGAVGMEFADDIALVTTADVPSLRASYDKIEMLSRLQIAKNNDIRLLFNKVSSRNEVQPEFGRRITGADSFKVAIPEDWRRLEPVANSLSPLDLEDGPFRRSVIALGRELRLTLIERQSAGAVTSVEDREPVRRTRRRSRRTPDDSGQVTIEAVVGLSVAMVIFLVLMQTALFAIGAVSARRAADAAALVGSRGGTISEAENAAEDRTPPMFGVSVRSNDGRRYEARLDVPTLLPFLAQDITATGSATD